MPKLNQACPQCGRPLELLREILLDPSNPTESKRLNLYKCGHLFSKVLHKYDKSNLDLFAADGSGKHARPYQEEGTEFILNSGMNAILGDQMRLGKTPQTLLALKNVYKDYTPCLILVRGANLWQWIREYKVWCDTLPNGIYPIIGGKAFIPPGFSSYIISMDTFSLQGSCKSCKHASGKHTDAIGKCTAKISKSSTCECRCFLSSGDSMTEKLLPLGIRCLIVDEAHSFKNTESNRSQTLVSFLDKLNHGEQDTSIDFTCSRCKHEWQEDGKIKFDKRIGNKIIQKTTQCPKCAQYCYVNQQHAESDSYEGKDLEKRSKLLALGSDTSTTNHERALALKRANDIKPIKEDQRACGLILLTGTAIKNRADEYFVPLNLIAPDKFNSLEKFRRTWLEQDSKGRWSRVARFRFDEFKNTIKPYVLRREKEDVFTDLPPLNRIFTIIEPEKDKLAEEYNKILDQMEVKLAEKSNPSYWDMAEDMMALRRICGMMKVMWAADYIQETLDDSENQKIAVGIHHRSVRDVLAMKLFGQCLKLSGEDNAERKDFVMRHFETSPERVLIINMLAGGVGMDFHYVNNVLILERQWSSADEDQFEFRFYNPDIKINPTSTNVEYIVAKGTIDEFFYDLVESKRKIFGETIANNWSVTADNGSFKDLVERTVSGRL